MSKILRTSDARPKALLVTTTTTVVASSYSSVVLMLRSPMLAMLAVPPARWPSGSVVHTADELHLTLCYLGDGAELTPRRAALEAAVAAAAGQLPPISGQISGMGRFVDVGDGQDAVYCSVDSPDLMRWLTTLQDGLEAAGFPCQRRHGHDPHVTLAYVPSGAPVDLPPPWPIPVGFAQLTLGFAGAYADYALGGLPWEEPGDVAGAAAAGAAAAEPEPGPEAASPDAGLTISNAEGGADGQGVLVHGTRAPEDAPPAEPPADGGSADAPAGEAAPALAGHPVATGADPPAESDALKAPAVWLRGDWRPRAVERKNDPESRGWKTLPHHTKDVDGRTVVGIYSVFGNVDSYDDVCMPGSFAKTFRERAGQIHHIWQHDTQRPPIAVIDRLQEVGRDALPADVLARYPDATGGAEVTRTYLEGPELANWVLEAIAKGAPLQMSYMYDPLRFEYVEQEGRRIRLLYEQRLWETSDVLWGANPATRASKALDLTTLPPLPLPELVGQLEAALTRAQKAGARHSASDTRMLNDIHRMVVALGCTTCKGMTDDEGPEDDPKAAPVATDHALQGPSLDQLRTSLRFFDLITQEI